MYMYILLARVHVQDLSVYRGRSKGNNNSVAGSEVVLLF